MSPLKLFDAIRDAKGLTSKAKLVAFVLAAFTDHRTGSSFPSLATLADRTQCDERTVRRAISELREAQWVTTTPGRHWASTTYTLTPERGSENGRADGTPTRSTVDTLPGLNGAKGGHHARSPRLARVDTAPGLSTAADSSRVDMVSVQGGHPVNSGWAPCPPNQLKEPAHEPAQPAAAVPAPLALAPSDGPLAKPSRPSAKHTPEQIAAKERIVDAFRACFKATKGGAELKVLDGGEHAAAFKLTKHYGAEEAIAIVRRAFEHDFVVNSKTSLKYIAANAETYRGERRGVTRVRGEKQKLVGDEPWLQEASKP